MLMLGGDYGWCLMLMLDYVVEVVYVFVVYFVVGYFGLVKMIWMCEDDLCGGYYCLMVLYCVDIGVDGSGVVCDW